MARHFETYAELKAACDADTFRYLPEYGPATFRCATCGELHPLRIGEGGTGYAIFRDAQGDHLRCYACCADYERQSMLDTGQATLYLTRRTTNTSDGRGFRVSDVLTDWAGVLRFVVLRLERKSRGGGFGSQRTDAWFDGPDGYVWHAVNRGDSEVARCKRTKRKTRMETCAAN